jgi:DnaK suppressor protein
VNVVACRPFKVLEKPAGGTLLKTKRLVLRDRKTAKKALSAGKPAQKSGRESTKDKEILRPRPKNKMNVKTKKEFRNMLWKLRERISGQITSLRDASLNRDDIIDLAEDGTDAFDRQFALGLVSSEHDTVVEIDEALQSIEDGTYGLCEQCFKAIDVSRLKAVPFVKLCVSCQSEMEKGKRKFRPVESAKGL